MAWPTINSETLEKPRWQSVPAAPAFRPGFDEPPDEARVASEKLSKLVSSLTAKAGKAKPRVVPKARFRQDKTISYEAYLRRKRLGLRVFAGLALAGLCMVFVSGLTASSGWDAEARAKRLATARYEADTLAKKITEMDNQVQALNGRAVVQANYLSELKADPAVHDVAADEAKAAAIGADLDRLTREALKLRAELRALGKEIIALQGP